MVSMKGLLYTVLGAAAAAAVVGTMIAPAKRNASIKSAKNNLGGLLGKAKSLVSQKDEKAEVDQASGHA